MTTIEYSKRHVTTYHETKRYRLVRHPYSCFELVRLADNATSFFQGDDAGLWFRNMLKLESIYLDGKEGLEAAAGEAAFDQSFDCLCSGYDDVLRAEG